MTKKYNNRICVRGLPRTSLDPDTQQLRTVPKPKPNQECEMMTL